MEDVMPPKIAPRERPAPDVLPDSLPTNDQPDVLPEAVEDQDSEDYEKQVDEAERASWQEHPEGSAPPLDRLTQDREPETDKE
jgi:hypothetical protein